MRRPLLAGAVLALSAAFSCPGAVYAQPVAQPPLPALPQSAEIQLKVQRDGSLSVAEAVSVPNGMTLDRRVPLRVADAHNRDRLYGVRDVVLEGSGTASVGEDAFTVHLTQGTSIFRYTVDGAVAGENGVERVTWELAGGWSGELKFIRASFAAPAIPSALDCFAGAPGTDFHCGAAQIDHAGLTRFSQQNLLAGQRMTATVELPAGTVPANARLVPSATIGGAFVATAPVGWAWAGFGAALLLLAALVWLARRRDAGTGEPSKVELISEGGEFASPEGVLPGHVGTVLTGRAGPVDLAATVLDLAVRNYLWVTGEDGDWRLTRRNPADEHLSAFERAVYALVLPDGAESVTLAELRRRHVGADQVGAVLYADVVRRGWYSRSPGRRLGRLGRAGIRVIFYGLFLTILLALTLGYAQLGLIVSLAGAAVAVASLFLPARRRQGAELRRRLLGVAEQVGAFKRKSIEKPQRELVFSRALPYALALGELGPWVGAFAELKHPPPVYWHGGDEPVTPEGAGAFAVALAGTFAGARRGRLLDAVRLV